MEETRIRHNNLLIRQATEADVEKLVQWWNDGAVMAHAGFPKGLGITAEKVRHELRSNLFLIEEDGRRIGECHYCPVEPDAVTIGIKICEADCQNRGLGRQVLSVFIQYLFQQGYRRIVLDTSLNNTRAQHVYESLGFRKLRICKDSWRDQLGRLQSSVEYELQEADWKSFL